MYKFCEFIVANHILFFSTEVKFLNVLSHCISAFLCSQKILSDLNNSWQTLNPLNKKKIAFKQICPSVEFFVRSFLHRHGLIRCFTSNNSQRNYNFNLTDNLPRTSNWERGEERLYKHWLIQPKKVKPKHQAKLKKFIQHTNWRCSAKFLIFAHVFLSVYFSLYFHFMTCSVFFFLLYS